MPSKFSQDASLSANGTTDTFPSLADQAVVIAGPTASGKSDLAMELAQHVGGEILSLDSIAVYRGMDIGTAKPSVEQRATVPHHMIDVVDPREDFSVARYLSEAHAVVRDIRSRGRLPIFVGGTPMFLKGVLRGFDPGPPADWPFREAVEAEVLQHGGEALHRRLWSVDPLAAAKIDPHDTRRMIRALEVAKLTGQPLSHRQVQFEQQLAPERCRAFVIQWDRGTLHERINVRVDRMFDEGLVDEVKRLIRDHGSLSRTASQAVGYREWIKFFESDSNLDSESFDSVKSEIAAHTRQLARRQETWYRSFGELTPVNGLAMQQPDQRRDWIHELTRRLSCFG